MKMNSKRLLVISGYISVRQHTGGVGMHVHRLIELLIKPKVSNWVLCDYKKESWWSQIKKIYATNVVHIHASNPYLRLGYALLSRILRKTSILTIHGQVGRYGKFKNFIDRIVFRTISYPVAINRDSYNKIRSLNKSALYIPAFIPPITQEEVLPEDVKNRCLALKGNGLLFVTNASRKSYDSHGHEIYGITFLVDYFRHRSEYALIVLDPQREYQDLNCREYANILVLGGSYSFCALTRLADFVVRNTSMDGDSFSVKEALLLHKKTLVSDAVDRPDGVFLFRYNDEASFEAAIASASAFDGEITLKEEDAIPGYRRLYHEVGLC